MDGMQDDAGTRPLADPRPFAVFFAVALVAIGALIWSLFRDPGLPAHVAKDYMSVAGGLVTPAYHTSDPAALEAALADAVPGTVAMVPDLDAAGFRLDGGRAYPVDGRPGVLAIYHGDRGDLLIYQAWQGSTRELPPADQVREYAGRQYLVHQKSSSALVFWQDGDAVRVLTAGLPIGHVLDVAFSLADSRRAAATR